VKLNEFKRLFIFVVISILILTGLSEYKSVFADSINPGVYPMDSKPFNMTYEDWTIEFWQWLTSIPLERNPMVQEDRLFCNENQGDLPVFFLTSIGGGHSERTCNVPSDKGILVPINVVECSFAEFDVKTEEELHNCAEEDESSNPVLFLSVDGIEFKDLEKYRVHSKAFDVNFPNNAIFGATPGPSRAVSDGYWVILEPLPIGKHDIHYKGSLSDPTTGILTYSFDLKYTINVSNNNSGT
jgi:hypothetical protein